MHLVIQMTGCLLDNLSIVSMLGLSTCFNNTTILDVGTRVGGSALALSYNENNRVISYDLVEQGASQIVKDNIEFKIQDFREDETLNYEEHLNHYD